MSQESSTIDPWPCCECGGYGDAFEVIPGDDTKEQVWVWCKRCNTETFYDLPDEARN